MGQDTRNYRLWTRWQPALRPGRGNGHEGHLLRRDQPHGSRHATQVPKLEDLLRQADFVTLHVPEIEDTKGMISTKEFEQMRKGAYLLNASRGSVVDIPALIKASQSGKLAGAALDVYPNEPGETAPTSTPS